MNRNVESHFSVAPTGLDVSRSMFDRSSSVKFSANVGELIPFYVDEVLPGDTFKVSTSKVVRFQTMLTPVMDNMYLDTYYFFVRNDLVWDHWKIFCGEANQAWTPNIEYTVPVLNIDDNPGVGSLADYMGIPTSLSNYGPKVPRVTRGVNALPFRAYAKICDDWFRDQSLTDPLVIHTDDTTRTMNAKSAADIYCELGGPVFKVAKYHDYFTSCLPAPQSGPAVKIPTLDALTKVGVSNPNHDGHVSGTGHTNATSWRFITDGNNQFKFLKEYQALTTTLADIDAIGADSDTPEGYRTIFPSNLYADVASSLGTINDLRVAFQVQKFYEKLSFGRRYIEILKSQFGVTSPDARLQRSEYLGGNRCPVIVHEVTNNSQAENAFLGDLGAMSRTVDTSDDFVHSFTEHGFVIGVCCVRYDHTYGQGLERFWSRKTMFDYYWPVFANIGNQAVYKKEIYLNYATPSPTQDDAVFGYQEAWADYRYKPSRVCGEMRPDVTGSLASWHLADDYDTTPSLSDSWIREDANVVDRTLAVTSAVSNQFFADIYVKNIATRVMPMYSIPGLADHH